MVSFGLKQGMLQLRKMKVPMFKGRWESTLSPLLEIHLYIQVSVTLDCLL